MNKALKELQQLIDLTGSLNHQIYLHNKLTLIKKLIQDDNINNNNDTNI